MPQRAYDRLVLAHPDLLYIAHASDTTGSRQAGYMVYVYEAGGVYYARSSYGGLGKIYRETDLGAFAQESSAVNEAHNALHKKLKKNYVDDTHTLSMKTRTAKPKVAKSVDTIPIHNFVLPNYGVEEPFEADWVDDDGLVLEWYPNRMRLAFFVFNWQYIAEYNIDGNLLNRHQYSVHSYYNSQEYMELVNRPLTFLGYLDPNNHIVLLRYLDMEGVNNLNANMMSYDKHRAMMEYFVSTLMGVDNTMDTDMPVYVSPNYATSDQKADIMKYRQPDNRFAGNLVVYARRLPIKDMHIVER